jgi:hypothetical protein
MVDFASGFPGAPARAFASRSWWLTTVDGGGTPARPVWFHWDGSTFTHFQPAGCSQGPTCKRNPAVAINLNSDPEGGGDRDGGSGQDTTELARGPAPIST